MNRTSVPDETLGEFDGACTGMRAAASVRTSVRVKIGWNGEGAATDDNEMCCFCQLGDLCKQATTSRVVGCGDDI